MLNTRAQLDLYFEEVPTFQFFSAKGGSILLTLLTNSGSKHPADREVALDGEIGF